MAYRELAQVGSKLPKITPLYVSEKSEKKCDKHPAPCVGDFPSCIILFLNFVYSGCPKESGFVAVASGITRNETQRRAMHSLSQPFGRHVADTVAS